MHSHTLVAGAVNMKQENTIAEEFVFAYSGDGRKGSANDCIMFFIKEDMSNGRESIRGVERHR